MVTLPAGRRGRAAATPVTVRYSSCDCAASDSESSICLSRVTVPDHCDFQRVPAPAVRRPGPAPGRDAAAVRAGSARKWFETEMSTKKLETDARGQLYFKLSEERVPSVIRRVFARKGWKEWDPKEHDESLWSIHWKSGRFLLSDWDRCLPHQLLNHCPKASNITQKANLHRNIKRLAGSYGSICNFVPTTYVLPNEYVAFMRECVEQSDHSIWIAKPSDSSRGRGIFLISDISELVYDQQYIIQKYIHNPFLIGGFKFDLRLYVLVPHFFPLQCYLYREGLVRFATDKYTSDVSQISNVYAHLTNSSINKYSPSLHDDKAIVGAGCKWTLSRLRRYLTLRSCRSFPSH